VTIREVIDNRDFYTGKVSELNRYLCFATIGVVWALSGNKIEQLSRPLILISAIVFVALVVDFSQYLYLAAFWSINIIRLEWDTKKEPPPQEKEIAAPGKTEGDDVVHHPAWMIPAHFIMIAKLVISGVAYALMLSHLTHELDKRHDPASKPAITQPQTMAPQAPMPPVTNPAERPDAADGVNGDAGVGNREGPGSRDLTKDGGRQ
jgi:hypothetical protein